ncbi:hypothetical protein [Sphingomonas sp. AX6]|uniref:hypothetical protein n=1 Tax=Sphingomonas sp. AX6 TaxID=2653171 RepID=UPI0012F25236|nr:hypothetical protein [Sphingomonas sp. AX6]VXC52350.1 conserved exported hypothetical protein [Sphingomonas sp. AX6]
MKSTKMWSAIALVAAFAVTGTSAAQVGGDIPLYDYNYYSDATYSELVGSQSGVCYQGYAGVGPTYGTITPYEQQVQVGVCRNGVTIYW